MMNQSSDIPVATVITVITVITIRGHYDKIPFLDYITIYILNRYIYKERELSSLEIKTVITVIL